jgi:hypothetical protein
VKARSTVALAEVRPGSFSSVGVLRGSAELATIDIVHH